MSTWNVKPIILALAVSVALSACKSLAPQYEQPQAAYLKRSSMTHPSKMPFKRFFWVGKTILPIHRLHRLIEIALERNTDLRTAALNAEALRKQYMITQADGLPSINASGSTARTRTAKDLSSTGNSYTRNAYSIGLGVTSYELDLFGKARSNQDAALESYFNSAASQRFYPSEFDRFRCQSLF